MGCAAKGLVIGRDADITLGSDLTASNKYNVILGQKCNVAVSRGNRVTDRNITFAADIIGTKSGDINLMAAGSGKGVIYCHRRRTYRYIAVGR